MAQEYGLPLYSRPYFKFPVPVEYEVDGNRIRVTKMEEKHIWIEDTPSILSSNPLVYRTMAELYAEKVERMNKGSTGGVSGNKLKEIEAML